jgi:peptide/nickel transport system permease protein
MLRFIMLRLANALPQLLLTSMLAFAMMKAAPGEREFMTQSDYERVSRNLGLNDSIPKQYVKWLGSVLQGEWGYSIQDGRKVGAAIAEALTNSLQLISVAGLVILLLALVAGHLAGTRAQHTLDYIISAAALVSFATPAFWLGLLLILLFAVVLDWLPSAGISTLGEADTLVTRVRHLVLPVTTIVLAHVGPYIRLVRGSVRDVLVSDYYRAAVARGLPRGIRMWRYELSNALTPFITWCGFSLPLLVGGTFIVEWVFSWPGIGLLFLKAAIAKNYTMLMAAVLVTCAFVIAGNLIADILVAWLNPKLRRQHARFQP